MPRRWIDDGQGGGHWEYLDFDAEWSSKLNRSGGVTEYDLPSVFHRLDRIQELIVKNSNTYASQYTDRLKNDFHKAVEALDLFMKEFCMDVDKMNAEEDLFFMCKQCPFEAKNKDCLVKKFKSQFCPDYKNFGSMGDL